MSQTIHDIIILSFIQYGLIFAKRASTEPLFVVHGSKQYVTSLFPWILFVPDAECQFVSLQ